MKSLIIAILAIFIIQSQSQYIENLQNFTQGSFKAVKASTPDLKSCFTEETAKKVIEFMPGIFQEHCNLKITQVLSLKSKVETFMANLPEKEMNCMYQSPEYIEFTNQIGLNDYSMASVLKYATFNLRNIKSQFCSVESSVRSNKYEEAGQTLAKLGATMLGKKNNLAMQQLQQQLQSTNSSLDYLQSFMQGSFDQRKISTPQFSQCFTETTANQIINFLPEIMNQHCNLRVTQALSLKAKAEGFLASLNESEMSCLNNLEEYKQFNDAIGLNDFSIPRVIKNLTFNLRKTKKQFCSVESKIKQQQYYDAGFQLAEIASKILNK